MIQDSILAFIEAEYQKTEENDKIIEKIDSLEKYDNINNEHLFDEFLNKWDQGLYNDK